MLIIAKFVAKILKVLNSEISPSQVAAGFAFGALIGFVPVKGLLPVIFLILSFVLNINLVMVALGSALFKTLSFAFDPLSNQIGYFLLTQVPSLQPIWTALYNMPLVPYTRFNNTIVLGSFVVGCCALLPAFLAARMAVVAYRQTLRQRFLKLRIVQLFQATSFYRYYQAFQGIRGE